MIALRDAPAVPDEALAGGIATETASESHPAAKTPASPRSGAFTEAQLVELWRGRRFPEGALVTRRGVPVNVIFQGRLGRGAGPDFRDAIVAGPSGVPLRGDIELHVRASSFRTHRHDRDPAYKDIILHVVFEDDTDAGETPLCGGGSAPVVALADWVSRRAGELERWLERPLLWREPCHDAVMRLGADGTTAALDAEGDRRLALKAARFAEAVRGGGVQQALYEGLLEALGYGGNAPAMLALARLLPWQRLQHLTRGASSREVIEAALLGSAGLLPVQRANRGPVEPYVDGLQRAFAAMALRSLSGGLWRLWGVRPENAGPRRVAAAAALLAALGEPGALLAALDARTVNEAIAPITSVKATGFWAYHYDPCANPCALPTAFVGRARALEIIINVVIPAAVASGDVSLAARARELYEKLPRPAAYGATRFLESALASEGVRLPLNGRRSQGLLALHRDWCTQGGCGRCPLS